MLFAKDKNGTLRQFTFGTDDIDIEQISTFVGMQACRLTLLDMSDGKIVVPKSNPVMKLLQGGKVI